MGLLLVSCGLPPHEDSVDSVPEIFLDFPELASWGRVVWIGGREYWQPDVARGIFAPPTITWAPYANGYFYDDALDGLVWVSYDPWGAITEHYGYWRHHEQLGYVWRPLQPLVWRPYVATILHDEDGVTLGMCPFYMGVWEAGRYDLGFGFDDSYWAPYWNGASARGFCAHHEPRFRGYCVSVTFYDAARHHRDQPESHAQRDRDERERRRHDDGRDSVGQAQRDRQPDAEPAPAVPVGASLPARPATAPSVQEPGNTGSSRPAADLPTIPPRNLDPRRERAAETEPPQLPTATEGVRPAEPQRPARAAPTPSAPEATPSPATPAISPKRTALPVIEPVGPVPPTTTPSNAAPAREASPRIEPAVEARPASQAVPESKRDSSRAIAGATLELPRHQSAPAPADSARPGRDSVATKPPESAPRENQPNSKDAEKTETSKKAERKNTGKDASSAEKAKKSADALKKKG